MFPINDRNWLEVAEFIQSNVADGDRIVAPSEFQLVMPNCLDCLSSDLNWDTNFQWFVIHKGWTQKIDVNTCQRVISEMNPVHFNSVFVTFTKHTTVPSIDRNNIHFVALLERLKADKEASKVDLKFSEITSNIVESNDTICENIDYSDLSVTEIKNLMDRRYQSQNAYNIVYLWDDVRAQELNRAVIEAITPTNEKTILEIGCGIGGSAAYIDSCKKYIGTDLSEVAVAQANDSYGAKPNFQFMAMDAMNLEFEDNRFDVAIAREVIEHLPHPNNCIQEVFRVLKSGGTFVVTSPNRDSFHLRVNRMLGNDDFKCSSDHVKEFTFKEAAQMLVDAGFNIQDTKGAFLMPYWGIPVVDGPVRTLTDDDPTMVEILRDMGERVGAEYAFCFIIICTKP